MLFENESHYHYHQSVPHPRFATLLALAAVSALAAPARAADTIETFAPGSADAELHVATPGPGPGGDSLRTAAVAGYGIARHFSGYAELDGDRSGAHTTQALHAGVFGTPLDTDHVDVDLLLDVAFHGWRPDAAPGFELNLDSAPDGSGAGAYLRLTGLPAGARAATLGAYTRVVDGQQLFIEHTGGAPWTELAVGFNAMLRDNLELVTQVSTDLHTGAFGSEFGVIITLPAPPSPGTPWSAPAGGWDWTGS